MNAALELLIERGAEATSIELVARRAGVTRATVYRRFPDKTRLLIAAIETAYSDPPRTPEIRDIEHFLAGSAYVLANARLRRLLRRLYDAIDDYPELARAYHDLFGQHRDRARKDVFERARDRGQLPADTDPDVLLDLLTGAVWQHLATRPDTSTANEIEQYLRAVLHQAGYRPDAHQQQPVEDGKQSRPTQ
ncbi:TetR/AcrR family transcriptional regulator [Nocardia vinacea]|uniref:TetR/AcrR family transcriptional regulator n=1 Tax=Nocardia vinacea TaxID=96468 RepID=UPI002E15DC67|nr:TetR/AcrR family transcriptional regulator [Nocardia vinacea]